jgi:PKD repeat protein
MNSFIRTALPVIAACSFASCTVHQTDPWQPSGPSERGFSSSVQALPDAISFNGQAQSAIKISARGPDGNPIGGATFRVDIVVGGVPVDFGALSSRTVSTGSDGIATAMYTAPLQPAGAEGDTCRGLPGTCVDIFATPLSTDFITADRQSVTIRLIPTGPILPPAGPPTASFMYSPQPVVSGVVALFDASASLPGQNSSSISSYDWSFGDGATASGMNVSHTYSGVGTFSVKLTVTNDRGVSASTTQQVTVNQPSTPIATIDASPNTIRVGDTVFLSGLQSTAPPGRTIVSYEWVFGDGTPPASGATTTHIYGSANTFTVTLTVTDDSGQKKSVTKTITVAP